MDNYLLIMGYILHISALIVKELKDMKYLAILFLFIACKVEHENYIDPKLQPYVIQFQIEAENLNIHLPDRAILMYFENLNGPNAECSYPRSRKTMTIKIDPKIFKNGFDKYDHAAEATIFHELGHGYLNRFHIENTTLIEPSLMAVPHNGRVHWIDGTMRELYINELFGVNL